MAERPAGQELKLLIRLLRGLREWTQAELAEAAGVDTSSICHYETGRTVPPRRTVERLAAAAGLPMSFVDACLLPALRAAQTAAAPFSGPAFGDLESAGSLLDRAITGMIRPALAAFLSTLEDREPWKSTGPPAEEVRLQAQDLCRRLESCTAEERRYLVDTRREFQAWPLVERLCDESTAAASDRADHALELAKLACRVAELAPGDEAWRARLQGYALAFFANALRVGGDLLGAEAAFVNAWGLWKAGAEADPGLLAEWRLLDLEASLHRGRRRFREALERLDQARAAAPPAAAARILMNKAATLEQMGEPERSIEALREAASLLDEQCEPNLRFALRFNLAVNLCHLSRYTEAEVLLPEVRELAVALGKQLHLVRVVWLEAKVGAGLGRPKEARQAFEQVRRDFTAREMAYDAALVTLELSALLLEQGLATEARTLAEEMLWIFRAQGVHREALAALQVFYQAATDEAATAELARQVLRYLYKAQHAPELRFEA
jgi:transcriptional regulator with XRE-family HTH domain